MKVRDAMSKDVVTVGEDATFHDVVETMLLHGVGGVPVVDAKGSLRGIITEADLLPKGAYRGQTRPRALGMLPGPDRYWFEKAKGLTAADVMTYPVVTVGPAATLRYATRRMVERQLKRLVVLDEGRVVGILSRRDVLAATERTDAELRVDVELGLRRCLFIEPEHDIDVEVQDGIVTLSGMVQTARDARIAATLAGSTDGVVGVVNRLRARQPIRT